MHSGPHMCNQLAGLQFLKTDASESLDAMWSSLEEVSVESQLTSYSLCAQWAGFENHLVLITCGMYPGRSGDSLVVILFSDWRCCHLCRLGLKPPTWKSGTGGIQGRESHQIVVMSSTPWNPALNSSDAPRGGRRVRIAVSFVCFILLATMLLPRLSHFSTDLEFQVVI